MNQKNVFIGYSSKEYSEATKACIYLESKGIKCWMEPRDILPGQSPSEQIVSAISQCEAFIVIASKETNESSHVLNEISTAFDNNKEIIGFKIEEFPLNSDLVYYTSKGHWINAFNDFEKSLDELYNKVIAIYNSSTTESDDEVETVIPDDSTSNFEETTFEDENKDYQENSNTENKQYKYCTSCGSKMDAILPICTNCGKPFSKAYDDKQYKYCTSCGSKMDAALPICTNCGKPFHDEHNDNQHKYCTSCGSKMDTALPFCTNCGATFKDSSTQGKFNLNAIEIVTLVFMIIDTIVNAVTMFFIPLLWSVPMIIYYINKRKKLEPIGTGFKICTILFIGLIPGILMFCEKDI